MSGQTKNCSDLKFGAQVSHRMESSGEIRLWRYMPRGHQIWIGFKVKTKRTRSSREFLGKEVIVFLYFRKKIILTVTNIPPGTSKFQFGTIMGIMKYIDSSIWQQLT